MAITVDDLARHLGFAVTPTDTETLDRALGAARALIAPHLVAAPATADQEHALDLATLTAAQVLWRGKDAVGGSYVYGDGSDQIGTLPRDVLGQVWPLLYESGLIGVVIA